MEQWLAQVSFHLRDSGALVATFLIDDKDHEESGWVYPECVKYKPESMEAMASGFGLEFDILDWAHPRQTWALFSKGSYDRSLIDGGPISWNRFAATTMGK
jgi:hypothetical protein